MSTSLLPGVRPRVLLAEPTLGFNRILKATLGERFDYFDAFDGADVLALLPRALPHLLIAELGLPGPDVLTICGRVHEHDAYAHTRIILLTTQADPHLDELIKECGVDACIRKPFRPLQLLDTVYRLLPQAAVAERAKSPAAFGA